MHDTHGVKVLQDPENLLDDLTGIVFLHMTAAALLLANVLLDEVVKLSALVKVCDDVVSVCIFEPLEDAHDSWMVKLRENLNLFFAFLDYVVEQLEVVLVDHFDSPEVTRLPVDAESDVAVAALFADLLPDPVNAVYVALIFEDEIADADLEALHLVNDFCLVDRGFLIGNLAVDGLGLDVEVAISRVVFPSFGLLARAGERLIVPCETFFGECVCLIGLGSREMPGFLWRLIYGLKICECHSLLRRQVEHLGLLRTLLASLLLLTIHRHVNRTD